jgi:hypothetical protein
MRLEINGGHRLPGEAVRGHIIRRLHIALGRLEERISRVIVRLTDLNGPRGGIDKCCRIVVSLWRRGRVVVEHRDADWFRAADLAAARLAHTVRRLLGRGHGRRRQRLRPSPDGASAPSMLALEGLRPRVPDDGEQAARRGG